MILNNTYTTKKEIVMAIRIDVLKTEIPAYRQIIKKAKKSKIFKACGNVDDPWIMLNLETEEEFSKWLSD